MPQKRDRALTLIASERTLRAIVLIAVGVVLITHTHTDWANAVTKVARAVGLDTNSQGLHRLLTKLSLLGAKQVRAYGAIAIAYGLLESVEAWGLFHELPWAEYLTVFATAILLLPEAWEIIKKPTPLKIGATIANLVIVGYLVRRLQRKPARELERAVGA